ncbi:hypothetical protein [Streptomyces sp. CL12]|uniref:hypothetical protein n=1 Tax=Streptomyces sp. CL12 TaxID=3391744 RepID=UPI003A80B371
MHDLLPDLPAYGLVGNSIKHMETCGTILEALWRERDLTAERHRAAFTALAREAKPPAADLAEALYERSQVSRAWLPYPDTKETLRAPTSSPSSMG